MIYRCLMLSNRRAACAVVSPQKRVLGSHYLAPSFVHHAFKLHLRRSNRLKAGRDLVLVRNYPTNHPKPIQLRGFSQSFKKTFLYWAFTNFNPLNHITDLDGYYFQQLRRVLVLFNYDSDGVVLA